MEDSSKISIEGERSRPPPPVSPQASSSSSSSSSAPSRRRRHRVQKENKESDGRRLDMLTNQVSEILNYLKNNEPAKFSNKETEPESDSDISIHPSEGLRVSLGYNEPLINKPKKDKVFEFAVSTNLKEPVVENASEGRLHVLNKLHHFNTNDWQRVRYLETEKKYVAKPGFFELDVNTELRHCDTNSSWLRLLDRSFGGLTHGLIQQNELLKSNFQQIIEWTHSPGCVLNADTLFEKISSMFSERSPYMKVSEDLLQLSCGRRADIIQRRRDCILSGVKDRYVKEDLQKIPPTQNNLFNPQDLTAFLQKAGGTSKLFAAQKRSAEEPHSMSMRNRHDAPPAKRPRKSFRGGHASFEPRTSSNFQASTSKVGPQKPTYNNSGPKRNENKKGPSGNRKSDRYQK